MNKLAAKAPDGEVYAVDQVQVDVSAVVRDKYGQLTGIRAIEGIIWDPRLPKKAVVDSGRKFANVIIEVSAVDFLQGLMDYMGEFLVAEGEMDQAFIDAMNEARRAEEE